MKYLTTVLLALAGAAAFGAIDWADPEVRRQAVVEMAYAYYLKADCVQYDSSPMARVGGKWLCSRRTKEGAPEDATPDSTYYTVCSSFPYETYFNAIGYRMGGSSSRCVTVALVTTPPEGATVFSYDREADPGRKNFAREMRCLRELLQPGDVIVRVNFWKDKKTGKRRGGGHALMYMGDVCGDGHPVLMHSGGAKYKYEEGVDSVERSGTIRLDDVDAALFRDQTLFRSARIVVIRPLALPAAQYPLSESAKARYLHPRLRIDRRVSAGPYGSVVAGGELTYSIWLKNFSKKPYTVPVRETIPEGCELVSCVALPTAHPCQGDDGRAAGQLAWDVPLAPGEERTLAWCVKVTARAGSRIAATGGTVAGIPSNTLVTEVVPQRMPAAVAHAWAAANVRDVRSLPDCRVTGWAGGYRSAEPPRDVRVADPRAAHLVEGDVVVVCPRIARPTAFRLWVKGPFGLEEMTPQGVRPVSDGEVTALLAKDFFAALRPARLPTAQDGWKARQRAVLQTAHDCYRRQEPVQSDLSFVNDVFRRAVDYTLCADPARMATSNLVAAPPPGIVAFSYDRRGDPKGARFDAEIARMRAMLVPGDVVAYMTDSSAPQERKAVASHAMLFVGDVLGDGHAQMLHACGTSRDAGDLADRPGGIRRSGFDTILHETSAFCLRKKTKIVVLRPLAAPICRRGRSQP